MLFARRVLFVCGGREGKREEGEGGGTIENGARSDGGGTRG